MTDNMRVEGVVRLRSGIGAKIVAEYDKLLPPCCRGFQDCIHNYMVRVPRKDVDLPRWGKDYRFPVD